MKIRLLCALSTAFLFVNAADAITEVTTKKEFEDAVCKNKFVFVKFFSPTCGPCKRMHPIIEKLSKEFEGNVTFLSVNTSTTTIADYITPEIQSVPTFMFFVDGKEFQTTKPGDARVIGSLSETKLEAKIKLNFALKSKKLK